MDQTQLSNRLRGGSCLFMEYQYIFASLKMLLQDTPENVFVLNGNLTDTSENVQKWARVFSTRR